MNVVVAAFEPFGGRRVNRSERAVRHLRGELPTAILPTSYARLQPALDSLMSSGLDALLLVGESRAARTLAVERFAVNLADARLPDNDGAQPRGVPLELGGPPAREVRFSIEALIAAIESAGVPASASAHAGTFCCNAALYRALASRAPAPLVAFVHVPAKKGVLRSRQVARGLHAAVLALVAQVGA